MNHQFCVADSAGSSIDEKLGGSGPRYRNGIGRQQKQSCDNDKSNYHR
jgi:hypothetical protein